MNGLYRELADRIRGALPDLDRVVARVMRAWFLLGPGTLVRNHCKTNR